jgi:hypothetical protein
MNDALPERLQLCLSMLQFAASRLVEAEASGDERLMVSAGAIGQIVATMDAVDDATLLKLASVDATCNGMLSQLIEARLQQVGFVLPLYESAADFFEPITRQVDEILSRARKVMH